MIIYKVINRINRKVYIGQTVQKLSKRWKSHCQPSMSSRSVLSRAIQKYGKESFIVEEIDGANSLSELNYLEKHYIYEYKSLVEEKGYNVRKGGNNSNLNCISKEKIRKRMLGNKPSKETKEKMKISWSQKSIEHFKKQVIDFNSGKIFKSVSSASIELKIPRRTLVRLLNNQTKPSNKYKKLKLGYFKEKR